MDFVGKTIKKEPKGIGIVNSYNPSVNLFELCFEDGSSEHLELSKITPLVFGGEEMGKVNAGLSSRVRDKKQSQNVGHQSGEDISYYLDNNDSSVKISSDAHRLNLNDDGSIGGFDLNVGGFNMDEEVGVSLDVINCIEEEWKNLERTSVGIDLNVDANGEIEENVMKDATELGVSVEMRERGFDLNMGLDEEARTLDEMKVQEGNIGLCQVVEEAQKRETGGGNDRKEGEKCAKLGGGSVSNEGEEVWFDASKGAHSEGSHGNNEGNGTTSRRKGSKGGNFHGVVDLNGFSGHEDELKDRRLEVCTPVPDNEGNFASPGTERKVKRRKKLLDSANSGAETTLRRSRRLATGGGSSVGIVENVQKQISVRERFEGCVTPGVVETNDLMDSEGKVFDSGTPLDHTYQVKSGSTRRGRKRRKTMELPDNGSSATEKLFRRTSRRLAAVLSTNKDAHSSAVGCSVLPPKLKLPPSSSEILDADGLPILDVFSVYTCLRSFSTLLFLSPFSLEDFVAALKCDKANMLFNSIHVSLLQTLRKHLELLSDENVLSASNCLRNLNWDLLDSITWPVFMVNYLLTHGSALKADFVLPKLKLLDSEYYKQAAVVKIEILRCLCDDVIEVEAIRSELNRRTLATEPNMDIDRNLKSEKSKRRRVSVDVLGGSCLTEEVVDEMVDWNSDDCCLCKMDGNLICCDGCPAAYHMKCVGVANNSLPDGDWYCPECVIEKDKPWLKMGKSLRGAEVLGVDPYGRLYYVCVGYLLVLDSCGGESSCNYYHRNDLTALIEAMKLSDPLYEPILQAISKHLNIYVNSNGTKSNRSSHKPAICLEPMKEQISTNSVLQQHVSPSESCTRDETLGPKHPKDHSITAQNSDDVEFNCVAKSEKMENLLTSSEGSVETSQVQGIQSFPTAGSEVLLKNSIGILNDSETGTIVTIREIPLASANLYGELGNNTQLPAYGHVPLMTKVRQGEGLQGQLRIGYVNYYSFAHTSSMVLEELTRRSADKNTEISTKSVEDIVSAQLKAISKRSTKFFWPIFQNLGADAKKEKCGWCFACRASSADDGSRDCFFNLNASDPQGFENELAGLCLRHSNEGHLADVICYILCMENRLRGLLVGPWQNPHYTELWRQRVTKATDVASLKYLLLLLEANLHHLVLSPEWRKHMDSVTKMGSASHIVTSSSRLSSKHGISRKRSRFSDVEAKPSLKAVTGLGLLWWRGGRLSRELFNWKVLPRALTSKAARQAGCTKVPGLLYPDSSDFTKRSRFVIWKSAVEASRSVEQLALQVRELDTNIRWDDIENTNPLSKMDQYKKSMRSFKKVIIRRKLTEGTVVKYLLDFGKRRFIPDIVVTHGSIVEESSSGRKKYWLEDTHVPLHLLKAFEERRIARKCNKMNPGKHQRSDGIKKITSKRKGFAYLFAKAELSNYSRCGHCNKDVLIREAVCCLHCKGFFHKRHVKKSSGATAAENAYSCHKCQGGNFLKLEAKKGKKPVLYKSNSAVGSRVLRSKTKKKAYKAVKPAQKRKYNKMDTVSLPLRRSPRNLKCVALQNKKIGKRKKGKAKSKHVKSARNVPQKPKRSVWQKKRTQAYHAYWLNGILFSRKANDERIDLFKGRSLIMPSCLSLVSMASPPKCGLSCEQDFTPSLSYISCEICGDWFHGDAFGLTKEKMDSVMGFRCLKCLDRTSPICPHLHKKKNNEAKSGEVNTCNGVEETKIPYFGGQSSLEDQEHGDISYVSGQFNVENSKNDEQRNEAVEYGKDVADSLAEITDVAMEIDSIKI